MARIEGVCVPPDRPALVSRRVGTDAADGEKGMQVSYRTLAAADAFLGPSIQMGVMNTDLAKQLGASTLGARLWRLAPGQASTRHRHRQTHELIVACACSGRARLPGR